LWFDGDSTVDAKEIINNVTNVNAVDDIFVESLTDEILQYNKLVPPAQAISVKGDVRKLTFEWNIPEEYKTLDVISYISDKLFEEDGSLSDIALREQRCAAELKLYREMGLFDTLRALIYIMNTLVEYDIVWCVGRVSSVFSYVLYIIGVHDVDSFQYNLNIEDFLRIKTSS